ncbi:KH domain-containing protein At4g18375 [Linum grandiflorum]
MGEGGKRPRRQREYDEDRKIHKRRINNKDEREYNDELVVYRILCPDEVIGSVIGKNGKVINSIRQETRAKVKVVDPFPGAKERVITIYCYVKEKGDVDIEDGCNTVTPLCAAQDALLKVHAAISNAIASIVDPEMDRKDKEDCRILVPSSQSSNIIGKAGMTIKKLRSKTRSYIKVIAKDVSDPSHACAMDFDNFLMISGESESVKRALFAVSAIMYKFGPKEVVPLETTVPDAAPSIIIPSDVPIYSTAGLYPNADHLLPTRSLPSIGPAHVPEHLGYSDASGSWPIYSSTLPIIPSLRSPARLEELIVRVLCPFSKIGRVIGKGGSTIKTIRQTTGARIEVDDKKVDRDECLITVTAAESPDDLKSMAVEAVLLLQEKMSDEDEDTVCMRLLITSKVIGCIIGRSGSIISEIRRRTNADIRISQANKPKCAGANDELVEVLQGEVGCVRDALVQIILRLREDVLRDRDGGHSSAPAEPLYSGAPGLPVTSFLGTMPPINPLGYDRRVEAGLLSSSSLHGYGPLSIGENDYGSMSSYSSSKIYGGLRQSSTIEMLVPGNTVGKVLGKGGMNIDNIRKISGAIIEISESRSGRGDRIAHISGTTEQRNSAENLIQAFMMAT